MTKKYIVSALVKNHAGVLAKVSGLFARRGYNIDGLCVCATENESFSRMTITGEGDEHVISQLQKQLAKLPDVALVVDFTDLATVQRELLLIKIQLSGEKRAEAVQTAEIYKAKTVDLSPSCITFELTGETGKIDRFIEIIAPYGIIELTRTGLTALARGENSLNELTSSEEGIYD